MNRRNKLRTTYIIVDYITANIVFLLFDICRFYMSDTKMQWGQLTSFLGNSTLVTEQALIPMLMVGIYTLSGFYNEPERRSRIAELITTFLSAAALTILIYLGLLINDFGMHKIQHYKIILVMFSLIFVITYIGRFIVTTLLFRSIRRGEICFNTVIIGNSRRARKVAQRLVRTQSIYGYNICGYVPIEGEISAPGEVPLISFSDVEKMVDEKRISDVIVALQDENDEQMVLNVMNQLFRFNVSIKVAAGSFSYLTSNIHIEDIYGEPLIEVSRSRLSECARNLKRVGDIVAAILALTVLILPMAVIAICVKLDSPGPAFYKQKRIGYRRRPFNIYKFRTMVCEAEADGPQLSSPDDSRITRIGRFLRKYRIDELPQFWNVIRGEMALVGPRPERAYFIEKILKIAPYYTLLQQVRPGLTSWGMVKYGYASTVKEMVKRSHFDLLYIGNMSFTVDMKILIFTIRTVLTGKGM